MGSSCTGPWPRPTACRTRTRASFSAEGVSCMDTEQDARQRELVEKDNRYVWHALSRYTPVEGGGSAPAPRTIGAGGGGGGAPHTEGHRSSRRPHGGRGGGSGAGTADGRRGGGGGMDLRHRGQPLPRRDERPLVRERRLRPRRVGPRRLRATRRPSVLPADDGPRTRGEARREAKRVAGRRLRLLLLELRLRGQRGRLQDSPPVPPAERGAGQAQVRLSLPGIPRQHLRRARRDRAGPAQVPLRAAGRGLSARRPALPLPLRVLQ